MFGMIRMLNSDRVTIIMKLPLDVIFILSGTLSMYIGNLATECEHVWFQSTFLKIKSSWVDGPCLNPVLSTVTCKKSKKCYNI